MKKEFKIIIARGISIYLIIGILPFLYFYFRLGFTGYLTNLLPASIAIVVFTFYTISGIKLLAKPFKKSSILFAQISLILLSIQLNLLGFLFQNNYGPEISLGFTDNPEFKLVFSQHLLSFWAKDGFKFNPKEISLSINLVFVALLLLLNIVNLNITNEERTGSN